MNRTLILILITTLSSCATITNKSFTDIRIHTTKPSKIIIGRDTLITFNNKIKTSVNRQKEPLTISVIADSSRKNVLIKSINSPEYYSNIFCNYGIGMLIDKKNPKRYTFPKHIYINSEDTISKYFRYRPLYNKGELFLHFSLPHINTFSLQPNGETTKNNIGFWGFLLGLDYYYKNNQFFNLSSSIVTDFFLPVPAAVDFSGEVELMQSAYVSLSNNHKINRFTFGYGISYGKNSWELKYFDRFDPLPPTRDPVKKGNNALGFIFTTYFQQRQFYNIGLIYRPTFIRFKVKDKFQYEHLISIDFAWKLKLR